MRTRAYYIEISWSHWKDGLRSLPTTRTSWLRQRAWKRDETYNTANLQLSLRQLAPIERCTIAWGTGPAFFFFKRFDFSFPLPNIPWPLADEKRPRSAASRCHGHVHAIATRRIARPSAVGWIAIKRHTRGPPLSMKRICTHGISCSCVVIHKYRAQ